MGDIRKLSPKVRTRPFETFINLGVGFVFLLVGALAVLFIGKIAEDASIGAFRLLPSDLVGVAIFGGIGLVGLNMVVQGGRQRPGSHGFFYVGLQRVGARFSPVKAWAFFAIYSLFAAFCARVGSDRVEPDSWLAGPIILGLLFTHILLHELAHWVGARRVGFAPFQLIAGPLSLDQRTTGWVLEPNREWLFTLGGVVRFYAREDARPRDRALVAAAGPAATTALVGLGWLVGYAVRAPAPWLATTLEANFNIGIGTLLLNLLPISFGQFQSDGAEILRCLQAR
jgi:hypothetical protein